MPMSDYSITYNYLTIGTGTNYKIMNIEGLGGTSPLRVQDDNRGYLDGSYTGRDFYDERTVYIDVMVLPGSSTTAQANYKALQSAFAPQQIGYYDDPTGFTPVAYQLKLFQFRLNSDTGDKRMFGRSRGIVTDLNSNFSMGAIMARITMTFPDPRYYDNVGTTVTGSSVSLTNSGWAVSTPTIILTTSATSGYITDGTTYMRFANMATGKAMNIDLLTRIVYYDTYPTRNIMTAASNGWLQLDPGVATTWTSTIGSITTTYRNAYI